MSANGSANKANKKHKLKLLKDWICKRATEKFITINQQKNFLKNKKITKKGIRTLLQNDTFVNLSTLNLSNYFLSEVTIRLAAMELNI